MQCPTLFRTLEPLQALVGDRGPLANETAVSNGGEFARNCTDPTGRLGQVPRVSEGGGRAEAESALTGGGDAGRLDSLGYGGTVSLLYGYGVYSVAAALHLD